MKLSIRRCIQVVAWCVLSVVPVVQPADRVIINAYGIYAGATLGWPAYVYYRQFHNSPVIDTSQSISDPDVRQSVNVVRDALYELDPERAKNIKLRLRDHTHNNRNVLEVGPRTIFITRDLAQRMSVSEVKGLIAHELGHVQNRDFEKKLCMSGASFFGSSCLWFYLLRRPPSPAAVPLCSILGWAINSYLRSPFSRKRELRADDHAARMGYGPQLASVLDDGVTYDKGSWLDRVFPSEHMFKQHRINRLSETQEHTSRSTLDEQ